MAAYTFQVTDERLNRVLESESRRRGVSVSELVLGTLQDAFLDADEKRLRYDELDDLAGSWSHAEADEFDEAVRGFAEIDRELWQD
ncbi:MAG: hypothetical protein EA426_19350 [Spirochaetaceae bacterium]|nr:MAG: hypothetical protein EA426_19350 [Spirochaetaceae bacterium]